MYHYDRRVAAQDATEAAKDFYTRAKALIEEVSHAIKSGRNADHLQRVIEHIQQDCVTTLRVMRRVHE